MKRTTSRTMFEETTPELIAYANYQQNIWSREEAIEYLQQYGHDLVAIECIIEGR